MNHSIDVSEKEFTHLCKSLLQAGERELSQFPVSFPLAMSPLFFAPQPQTDQSLFTRLHKCHIPEGFMTDHGLETAKRIVQKYSSLEYSTFIALNYLW